MKSLLVATLIGLTLAASGVGETCLHPFVLRAAPGVSCPAGSNCSEKSAELTYVELDSWALNSIALCESVGTYAWPAPAAGFFRSDGLGAVNLAPIGDADVPNSITVDFAATAGTGDSATAFFSAGTIESARLPTSLTVDLGAGGAVTGGTASRCARFNASGNLVAATGDCAAGDTGGGGGGGAWTTVIKTADETLDFTATFQDDNHLFFTASASTGYVFRANIKFTTTGGADFKLTVSGPSSPTIVHIDSEHKPGGSSAYAATSTITGFDSPVIVDGTGANGEVRINGFAILGASGGTIKIQWAQLNGGAGGPTIVRAGSYIEYATLQ